MSSLKSAKIELVYDLYQLLKRGVALAEVWPALPIKFKAKGMRIEELRALDLQARRSAFEADWHRRLIYLLPRLESTSFQDAWESAMQVMRLIAQ